MSPLPQTFERTAPKLRSWLWPALFSVLAASACNSILDNERIEARPVRAEGGAAGAGGEEGGAGGAAETEASCRAQQRSFQRSTQSCGPCLSGYVDDGDACVKVRDCDQGCTRAHGCYPLNGACFRCEAALTCSGEGLSGRVLSLAGKEGSACVCETLPGYFIAAGTSAAARCDHDGDGWTSVLAQPALDGEDDVSRLNTRCDVRSVQRIVLQTEAGEEHALKLPSALPLYETPRNDGTDAEPTRYHDATLAPAALNSFTKGCDAAQGDFDDNGVADVSEWSGVEAAGVWSASSRLSSLSETYARFAYYLELHDGWYEAAGGGSYHIAERQRTVRNGGGVPLVYGSADEHWRECSRHSDVNFREDVPSRAGADFTEFADAWPSGSEGMTHTSQFKCVAIVAGDDYSDDQDLEHNPELAFIEDGQLVRQRSSGERVTASWIPNVCALAADPTPGPNGAAFARLECEARELAQVEPGVYWMAVDFAPYAEPKDYERGCIDECAERSIPVPECLVCNRSPFGASEVVAADSGATCSAGLCDGNGTCGNCVPGRFRCTTEKDSQVCGAARSWLPTPACPYGCNPDSGQCFPDCSPGAKRCTEGKPELCSAAGSWERQTPCASGQECKDGRCLKSDATDCAGAEECVSGACSRFYRDADTTPDGKAAPDGFGDPNAPRDVCGTSAPNGYVKDNTDCCDTDPLAHPGQTSNYPTARRGCDGFDFDCDGKETPESVDQTNYCFMAGWEVTPSCGQAGSWLSNCYYDEAGCNCSSMETRTQACR